MGHKIFLFIKSKQGIMVLSLAVLMIVYFVWNIKEESPRAAALKPEVYVNKKSEVEIKEKIPEIQPQKKKERKQPVIPKRNFKKDVRKIQKKVILPIDLYTARPSKNDINPENYAPYGRLVKCELVITVDSSRIDTPIIAMVIEDLVHNGVVIIPAGTELHGTAAVGNMRNRIASSGSWTFVWRTRTPQNGLELSVKGMVLDMEQSGSGEWAITDGSAGLRGRVIDTTEWATLMAIAASFVSGIGEGMAQRLYTTDGNITEQAYGGTFKDALGKGLERAANVYAQQMLKTITRDGVFIRVPAGKQFYLYVQETINLDKAEVGGTKIKHSNFLKPAGRIRRSIRRKRI